MCSFYLKFAKPVDIMLDMEVLGATMLLMMAFTSNQPQYLIMSLRRDRKKFPTFEDRVLRSLFCDQYFACNGTKLCTLTF